SNGFPVNVGVEVRQTLEVPVDDLNLLAVQLRFLAEALYRRRRRSELFFGEFGRGNEADQRRGSFGALGRGALRPGLSVKILVSDDNEHPLERGMSERLCDGRIARRHGLDGIEEDIGRLGTRQASWFVFLYEMQSTI